MINSTIGNTIGPFTFTLQNGVGYIKEEPNNASDSAKANSVNISAGNKTAGTGNGGDTTITAGTSVGGTGGKVKLVGASPGGAITLQGADASSSSSPAACYFFCGKNTAGPGANLEFIAGQSSFTNGTGGFSLLQGGTGSGNPGTGGNARVAGGLATGVGGTAGSVTLETAGQVRVTVDQTGNVNATGNIRIAGNLGVGNATSATTLGTVTKKIEIFDASGNSLGFIPVYNSIT